MTGHLGDPVASVSVTPGAAVVSVTGEIDLVTVGPLRQALFQAIDAAGPGGEVVVDLSRVDFMGSRGLTTMLEAREQAGTVGVALLLRCPSNAVTRALRMSALDAVFTITGEA